jgi:hypothetical protein
MAIGIPPILSVLTFPDETISSRGALNRKSLEFVWNDHQFFLRSWVSYPHSLSLRAFQPV